MHSDNNQSQKSLWNTAKTGQKSELGILVAVAWSTNFSHNTHCCLLHNPTQHLIKAIFIDLIWWYGSEIISMQLKCDTVKWVNIGVGLFKHLFSNWWFKLQAIWFLFCFVFCILRYLLLCRKLLAELWIEEELTILEDMINGIYHNVFAAKIIEDLKIIEGFKSLLHRKSALWLYQFPGKSPTLYFGPFWSLSDTNIEKKF